MLIKELNKAYWYILSIPKTIYINFKYLRPSDAIRFPIIISHRVSLAETKGKVFIDSPHPGMVQIGFDRSGLADMSAHSCWSLSSTANVYFKGKARISSGTKLIVSGTVIFGKNFNAGENFSLYCANEITFGRDNLLSWNVTVMDHDFHQIRDSDNALVNAPQAIKLGDHVWIGCHVLILKGSQCSSGNILAAGSLLTKHLSGENQLIGGVPATVLKPERFWHV